MTALLISISVLCAAGTSQFEGNGSSSTSERVELPGICVVDSSRVSLPLFTVILAALDGFNPCAFFVLLFLMSLLIHSRSRGRMLAIGGTFVFFSGAVYFLFMAMWLNMFILVGRLALINAVAGIVAIAVAFINIKDFFFFRKLFSLSIPEWAKPRLFERMRGLLKSSGVMAMLMGTAVLAFASNSYELLCTAGFPMVFTRALTLRGLSPAGYYLYLLLYNTVYVIPLAVIVVIFVVTLGARKLTERHGQVLKLISGMMMLCLGLVLLIKPEVLTDVSTAVIILITALATSGILVFITDWIRARKAPYPQ